MRDAGYDIEIGMFGRYSFLQWKVPSLHVCYGFPRTVL